MTVTRYVISHNQKQVVDFWSTALGHPDLRTARLRLEKYRKLNPGDRYRLYKVSMTIQASK